jgi:hypothetical protein
MTLTVDRTAISDLRADAWEDAITLDAPRAYDDPPRVRVEQYPVIGATALDLMAAIAGPTGTVDYGRAWNTAFEIVTGMLVCNDASVPADRSDD